MQETANFNYVFEQFFVLKNFTTGVWVIFGIAALFLQGVISTAIDLAELHSSGVSPMIYADIEASSKLGGLRYIAKIQSEKGSISYSVSDIGEHDTSTAMNYLGLQLSTTLTKGIHELPLPLRNQEMLLRGVESLLSNLLNCELYFLS